MDRLRGHSFRGGHGPDAVLLVDARDSRTSTAARVEPSFYLTKALSIGTSPAFQIDSAPGGQLTPAQLEKHSVVVLNDVAFPPALARGALRNFVERGGGVLVVLGERTTWSD